jgi:AcrR family transcriptional regulator/DNA-binding MarR family transcriptional regulator
VLSAGVSSDPRERFSPGAAKTVVAGQGDVLVSEAQRSRVLRAAVQVVSAYGYEQMSVARIATVARVSRRTFYDLFEDREDCFLAAFDDAVARAGELVLAACEPGQDWGRQTRSALTALLVFFDEEPGVRSLLIVDALKAGLRVQERRAHVLARLGEALHEGVSRGSSSRDLPALTSEGVVGAVFTVIHTRLLGGTPGSMLDLLNPLMGIIMLPFLGSKAAARELRRSLPEVAPACNVSDSDKVADPDLLVGISMRMTHRTLLVLRAITEQPGASNRRVASEAGVTDQGQISKLLARLEGLELIKNKTEGQHSGEPNVWHLTPKGQQLQQAIKAQPTASRHERDDTRESR